MDGCFTDVRKVPTKIRHLRACFSMKSEPIHHFSQTLPCNFAVAKKEEMALSFATCTKGLLCRGIAAVAARRPASVAASSVAASGQQPQLQPPPLQAQQIRHHHPDPFNPKTTKGWAAALKVKRKFVHCMCVARTRVSTRPTRATISPFFWLVGACFLLLFRGSKESILLFFWTGSNHSNHTCRFGGKAWFGVGFTGC